MIHFYWPWFFLVIPFPYLIRIFLYESKDNKKSALKVPFLEDFLTEEEPITIKPKSKLLGLVIIAWLFLITAIARPQ